MVDGALHVGQHTVGAAECLRTLRGISDFVLEVVVISRAFEPFIGVIRVSRGLRVSERGVGAQPLLQRVPGVRLSRFLSFLIIPTVPFRGVPLSLGSSQISRAIRVIRAIRAIG